MNRLNACIIALALTAPVSAFAAPSSPSSLIETYRQAKAGGRKVKVLIVPGHDAVSWGTEFRKVKEADLSLALSKRLYSYFAQNPAYDVQMTRMSGSYTETFGSYFLREWLSIQKFRSDHIAAHTADVFSGKIAPFSSAPHNNASQDVSTKLFGINKWVNENAVDLVIHVHFNDEGGRRKNKIGEYDGFAIYAPESQLPNSPSSVAIAQKIAGRLALVQPASSLPVESSGVVPERDLIAIGSNGTLDAASILIEYGYIYEPQIMSSAVRDHTFKEYAYRTYVGVEDFFGIETSSVGSPFFPHTFKKNMHPSTSRSGEVMTLQTALAASGVYPGAGLSLHECPISGVYGECTEIAVKEFQRQNGFSETGVVDGATRTALSALYGK